jgi:hypothetical protein
VIASSARRREDRQPAGRVHVLSMPRPRGEAIKGGAQIVTVYVAPMTAAGTTRPAKKHQAPRMPSDVTPEV